MIRIANQDDKEGVVCLIKAFFEEYVEGLGFAFDEEKVSTDFDLYIALNQIKVLVIDEGETLTGLLVVYIGEQPFFKGLMADEMIWYVLPDHRRQGIKLLRECENMCKQLGCEYINVCGFSGTKAENIYEKMGYKHLESKFIKKIGE